MSFMTFIKSILKAIFGSKSETTSNTISKIDPLYIYMSEDVKGFILSGHSVTEQAALLKQIAENEAAKNEEYKIDFDNGYYIIENGQIVGTAKYEAKNYVFTGKMSPSVRMFVLAGHKGEERESIEKQIDEADAANKSEYQISFSNGYYNIKDGQVVGGAKGIKA